MNILLSGIVGSRAYGLETEHSDTDVLGVYACDTRDLHGLGEPLETYVTVNPDAQYHEARKYVRLALKCNPTVTELMWLPEYQQRSWLGSELINIRGHFLSQGCVRDAYLGYASQQFKLLKAAHPRVAKHARHLRRLLYQGTGLWAHGELTVKVSNPGAYHEFGERVAAGEMELAAGEMAWAERYFDEVKSPLPEKPNTLVAERWLRRVRTEFWKRS